MIDWSAVGESVEERIAASFRPDLVFRCCRCGEVLSIGHSCIKWVKPVRDSDGTEEEGA